MGWGAKGRESGSVSGDRDPSGSPLISTTAAFASSSARTVHVHFVASSVRLGKSADGIDRHR